MPIEFLAEARSTERSDLLLLLEIFRSSESKASVVCLKVIASSIIRKIALLILTKLPAL